MGIQRKSGFEDRTLVLSQGFSASLTSILGMRMVVTVLTYGAKVLGQRILAVFSTSDQMTKMESSSLESEFSALSELIFGSSLWMKSKRAPCHFQNGLKSYLYNIIQKIIFSKIPFNICEA